MKKEELIPILEKHVKWLNDEPSGIRADLRGANLRDAKLSRANLSTADLSGADMSGADMRGADLRGADLRDADLRDADMSGANLRDAKLSRANLSTADLRGADMSGANLDYSSGIPLWCGGTKFKTDMKLIRQVLAHLATLECADSDWPALKEAILPEARKSHRASDLEI
jgi:hypothetical protein